MKKFSYEKLRFSAYLVLDRLSKVFRKGTLTNSVLIVRQDAIGDFILWLDAARFIAGRYRADGRRVVLLANKNWAPWASELGLFDEVIAFDPQAYLYKPRYRLAMNRRIRGMGFATAVQPAYSRDYSGDVLIRLSGAPERIAFVGDNANLPSWMRPYSEGAYTRLLAANPAPKMELLRNAEFVRWLFGVDYAACVAHLDEFLKDEPNPALDEQILADEPFYVLFPGASWIGKQWPLANFARLAERLHRETKLAGCDLRRTLGTRARRESPEAM